MHQKYSSIPNIHSIENDRHTPILIENHTGTLDTISVLIAACAKNIKMVRAVICFNIESLQISDIYSIID